MAPEAKYPNQVEQNYAVAQWITREGARHALDASRLAVARHLAIDVLKTALDN